MIKAKIPVLLFTSLILAGAGLSGWTTGVQAQTSDAAQTAPQTTGQATQAPETAPIQASSPSPATQQPDTAPQVSPVVQNAGPQSLPLAHPPLSQPVTLESDKILQLPHDLSPWGMFMAADWVVKAVMIGLGFASLITWTVWLAKSLEITTARSRAKRALKEVSHAQTLGAAVQALGNAAGPGAHLVRAAQEEVAQSAKATAYVGGAGLKERVASRLSRIEAGAGRRMAKGTGVLATIGSTAPFVGLFGTVWGIMNSFIGISEAQTTNLAVVAPGIAEALLATAIGLVAAIPAVIIYNVFARSITAYRHLLADVGAGVERLVSRDIDMHKAQSLAQQYSQQAISQASVQNAAE